jgi:hypothetical protein
MIKSQLAAALAVETAFRAGPERVTIVDERLHAGMVVSDEVARYLHGNDEVISASPVSDTAQMVVAWEALRHAFRPRAALDRMCGRLAPGGRFIYAQQLVDQYLGLTAKWLLDYFVAARYADCRIYLLWSPADAPAVVTFDYEWMLKHAGPVYNPMWDNINHAEAVVVVAEKDEQSKPGQPSQDIYRLADEWEHYAAALARLAASSRPDHLAGPAPARVPPGFRSVAAGSPFDAAGSTASIS